MRIEARVSASVSISWVQLQSLLLSPEMVPQGGQPTSPSLTMHATWPAGRNCGKMGLGDAGFVRPGLGVAFAHGPARFYVF